MKTYHVTGLAFNPDTRNHDLPFESMHWPRQCDATGFIDLNKNYIKNMQIVTTERKKPMLAYILIADGEFDQVCESLVESNKQTDGLKALGCRVKVKVCPWAEQDSIIDKLTD